MATRRAFLAAALAAPVSAAAPQAPYPKSTAIRGMTLDWSTHKRDAPGSDNWQLTWADDGHLYGAWGDGGGFGGTNNDGRVSLGFARVEGGPENYKGLNVWGGKNALTPGTFAGKCWGTIARLYRSADHGLTWTPADWAFTRADDLSIPTICQFGRDYSGARDEHVYHYFTAPREANDYRIQRPGAIHLARSPKDAVTDRASYEFFAGGKTWTRDLSRKKPVFEDRENGVGWVSSVMFNAGLERYILITDHTASSRGNIGVFEAPEPWGPWRTVLFLSAPEQFGAGKVEPNCFFWSLPAKWMSRDGRSFWMVFTGAGRGKDNDSFNLIEGVFEV